MVKHLFDNGTVLDCTGASPKKDHSVFTDGNRIRKVGPASEVRAFAEEQGAYRSVDARGMTIMPGIVDSHCHPSYNEVTSVEALDMYGSAEYRTLKAALAIRKILRAGVTTVGSPGGTWKINVALRDAVNAGLIEGPRMVAGGHYISTWNGTGSFYPTHMQHPPSSFAVVCNTRDEMVEQVRREIKDGVDIIKISGDGDTSTNRGMDLLGSITPADLSAIVEIAHRMKRKVTIHARSGRASAEAAAAGLDWIIHGSFMSEDDLAVVIEHGTPLLPTLSLLAGFVEWGADLGASQAFVDFQKYELEAASGILSKAYREGVTIMAGTDSGMLSVPSGEWHAREMEHLMTYLGMSAMDALLAGTRNGAEVMGLGEQVGTLEEGKFADVLLVNGDPLADIQVLQDKTRLVVIMKDGRIVDTETPLPEPLVQSWEKPLTVWPDPTPRLATQEWVREHATSKPKWMHRKLKAA